MYLKNKMLIKAYGVEKMLDNLKFLNEEESILEFIEMIQFLLLSYQDISYTESFIKYSLTKLNLESQIYVLQGIKLLVTETNPAVNAVIKQIIDSKGFEIIC